MDMQKMEKIFKDAGIDTTITCPQAFALAEKHKIPKKEISEYCNSQHIKIRGCQLGCFK